jgi:hypothetical protein
MKKRFAAILLIGLLIVGVLWWRHSPFEINARGQDVHIDKINLAIPMLWRVMQQHPGAQSFCVSYRMIPGANEPNVFLPRTIDYDRSTHVLRWSREFWFESYAGASDDIIKRVAEKEGGVRMLLKLGCKRTFPRR